MSNDKWKIILSPGQTLSLVFFQRLRRLLHARGQRTLGKSLEVRETGVLPPDSVALLNRELLGNRGVSLGIDLAAQSLPISPSRAHPIHPMLITQRHLVPQFATRAHPIIPCHMMKPEQELLGTSIEDRKLIANRVMILTDRIAAGRGAIEPDSFA